MDEDQVEIWSWENLSSDFERLFFNSFPLSNTTYAHGSSSFREAAGARHTRTRSLNPPLTWVATPSRSHTEIRCNDIFPQASFSLGGSVSSNMPHRAKFCRRP